MHNVFPHLQLWRSVDGCRYTLIGDTELSVPDSPELMTQTDYVFSGTPAPAVGFQTRDILGLYQPREQRSRVRVYYDTSTGPLNYYNDIGNAIAPPDQEDFLIITADGMENGLPLLAVEISKLYSLKGFYSPNEGNDFVITLPVVGKEPKVLEVYNIYMVQLLLVPTILVF